MRPLLRVEPAFRVTTAPTTAKKPSTARVKVLGCVAI